MKGSGRLCSHPQLDGDPRHLLDFVERDGGGSPRADCLKKGLGAVALPLILAPKPQLREAGPAVARQAHEVVESEYTVVAEDLDALLRKAPVTVREVMDVLDNMPGNA